ncbi:hypothetical protein NB698_000746 [Pantoea dispersa]|nr:hypothetical protein [Pantoea dispersa]
MSNSRIKKSCIQFFGSSEVFIINLSGPTSWYKYTILFSYITQNVSYISFTRENTFYCSLLKSALR